MNGQNIPPPPQYPNAVNNDIIDQNVSKENSIMENSVVYISDNGSPNYKNTRQNDYYGQRYTTNNHQILPNLVNSINNNNNNTYHQTLPPKSPKSNYRHLINPGEMTNQKLANTFQQYKSSHNGEFHSNNNTNNGDKIDQNYLYTKHYINTNSTNFNVGGKNIQNNHWYKKPEDWESNDVSSCSVAQITLGSIQSQPILSTGKASRSHPNLMNDYVNLSNAEPILNEILNQHRTRTKALSTTVPTQNYYYKPIYSQFGSSQQPFSHITSYGESSRYPQNSNSQINSPEFILKSEQNNLSVNQTFNNNASSTSSTAFSKNIDYGENFSTESSRLVNLLLEENKRLRSKLRQSDTRLEVIDQLERKIHNLEILFEELLTSQRRQRLLDLQLQQASLTNYLSTRSVMSHQDVSTLMSPAHLSNNHIGPNLANSSNNINGTFNGIATSTAILFSSSNLNSDAKMTDNTTIITDYSRLTGNSELNNCSGINSSSTFISSNKHLNNLDDNTGETGIFANKSIKADSTKSPMESPELVLTSCSTKEEQSNTNHSSAITSMPDIEHDINVPMEYNDSRISLNTHYNITRTHNDTNFANSFVGNNPTYATAVYSSPVFGSSISDNNNFNIRPSPVSWSPSNGTNSSITPTVYHQYPPYHNPNLIYTGASNVTSPLYHRMKLNNPHYIQANNHNSSLSNFDKISLSDNSAMLPSNYIQQSQQAPCNVSLATATKPQ